MRNCKWNVQECADEETSMFAKLSHVVVCSIVWVCECFHKFVSMSCHCVKQGMQSRWGSLFAIIFMILSFEDATMSCECASQLFHLDYQIPLVTQVKDPSGSFVLDTWNIFLVCNLINKLFLGECEFLCFAFDT